MMNHVKTRKFSDLDKNLPKDYRRAKTEKLENEALMPALILWREKSDLQAKQVLIKGLRWMAYRQAKKFLRCYFAFEHEVKLEDIIGETTIGLLTAIDRLANNTVKNVTVFVRKEIKRSVRDFRREMTGSNMILVPSSTKSTQKVNKVVTHVSLSCQEDVPEACNSDWESDRLSVRHTEKQEYLGPYADQNGNECVVPSKFLNLFEEVQRNEIMDILVKTTNEEAIFPLFKEGYRKTEIREILGLTAHALKTVMRTWNERALDSGLIEQIHSDQDEITPCGNDSLVRVLKSDRLLMPENKTSMALAT